METNHDTLHVEISPSEDTDRDAYRVHANQVRERLTSQFPVHCELGFGWLHIDVPPGDFHEELGELLEELHEQGLIAGDP